MKEVSDLKYILNYMEKLRVQQLNVKVSVLEERNLTPLIELIPKDVSKWCFLKEFLKSKKSRYYCYEKKVTLSKHIGCLDIYDYHDLLERCESIYYAKQTNAKNSNPLSLFPSETKKEHFRRLLNYFQTHNGDHFLYCFSNSFIQLDQSILYEAFVLQNFAKIPPNYGLVYCHKDEFRSKKSNFPLTCTNEREILLSQVYVETLPSVKSLKGENIQRDKNGNHWLIAEDYSELRGPNIHIKPKNSNAVKMLKACLELHRSNKNTHHQSQDFFEKAELSIYDRKLGKFLSRNPSFKRILLYREDINAYKIDLPQL
ncbi:hypothetical protein [Bacteriovorax sp. Seq25_V]|uniref:hypothetical protein n=1 Tax=Bacteriovorax sp. Seq25_V TaxID=1201288 RepID=UPI00054EFC9E|nr:hypothetical protein [Bacteriovorax sp. Seq25_V]